MTSESGTLDPRLLAVLACPDDKGPLYYLGDQTGLYNPRLHRLYEVINVCKIKCKECQNAIF